MYDKLQFVEKAIDKLKLVVPLIKITHANAKVPLKDRLG
jgi:hypothetical protein